MLEELVGWQFGNYSLRSLLGRGSFADVYLGEHIYLKTRAAIKVLRLHLIDEACVSFLREAQTVAHLEHASIVRVLEFGVEGDVPFLVMNYAPSGTLRNRLQRAPSVPSATMALYLKQLASALDYAHEQGVIHRDVKPENILLKSEGEVFLGDFGLARVRQFASIEGPFQGGGTPVYMAPEQIEGEARAASDQYALGVMLYEWLTGRYPFEGTEHEILVQHLYLPPPYMNIEIPGEVEEVVRQALSKEPAQRFPCVLDFARAFERVAALVPPSLPLNRSSLEGRSSEKAPSRISLPVFAEPVSLLPEKSSRVLDPFPALPQDEERAEQLVVVPVHQLATVTLPEKPVPELADYQIPPRSISRHARRKILFSVVGIILLGILSVSLFALSGHGLLPLIPSRPTTFSPTITAQASSGHGSPAASSRPGDEIAPGGHVSPGPSVGPAGASPPAGPDPGANSALSLQFLQYPVSLANNQVATITVLANEPGVDVTLDITYDTASAPGKTVHLSRVADGQGKAIFSWKVQLPHGHNNDHATAILQVSASNAQGQTASASPLSLPVEM